MNPDIAFDAQQLGEPVPRNSHSAELVYVTESEELICFGMLTTLTAHVVDPLPLSRYRESEAPIHLQGDRSLVFSDSGLKCGKIESRDSQLLQLLTNEGIEFDLLYLHRDHHLSPDSVSILATIYGPREKAKSLGVVLQSLDYYLQDPKFAVRDLEYFNPHRFANTPDARATDFRTTIPLGESLTSEDEAVISVAILDTFTTQLSFPTQLVDPPYLLTQLKSHQKQALWFMVQRETGWNMGEHGKDVWSQQHDSHGQAM
ncbi:uncharacterized protein LY79DRAFT_575031 [Colletotrichum navitas]|uniref:Uncharacterized protein n=1 Tax=Colletotrichum navitas TaxID=681940 RepID=A0AAD8VAN5_9PEZI|nr:uncharacterized protein LY79DRAFT_575031 [Colletotrichum navitas]KAK1599299.1 hypothetical protein LY79DRAFT_575031 [Colletotrichum navitas]